MFVHIGVTLLRARSGQACQQQLGEDDGCQTTGDVKSEKCIWQLDDIELGVKESLSVRFLFVLVKYSVIVTFECYIKDLLLVIICLAYICTPYKVKLIFSWESDINFKAFSSIIWQVCWAESG